MFVAKILSWGVSRPPVTQVGVRLVKWLCPRYVLCATSMASPRQFWRTPALPGIKPESNQFIRPITMPMLGCGLVLVNVWLGCSTYKLVCN